MRTLQQPRQGCTASHQRWHTTAAARRSASLHRAATASAGTTLLTDLQLPKTSRPLQNVLNAQAAAEAAQQELLATGPLADAAATGNKLVHNILSTYSTVQRLYHKAVLPVLERHPQYIDSPAGKIYSEQSLQHVRFIISQLVVVGGVLWWQHLVVAAAHILMWRAQRSRMPCPEMFLAWVYVIDLHESRDYRACAVCCCFCRDGLRDVPRHLRAQLYPGCAARGLNHSCRSAHHPQKSIRCSYSQWPASPSPAGPAPHSHG